MEYKDLKAITAMPGYAGHFENMMRGRRGYENDLKAGYDTGTSAFHLPLATSKKYDEAVTKESVLRNICTVIDCTTTMSHLFVSDAEEIAEYIGEGDLIDPKNIDSNADITQVKSHKLSILIRAAEDFVHQTTFDFESLITGRLARAFARGEDRGFLIGTGADAPKGLLSDNGAEAGVTTASLTYDNMISLYFSVLPKHRKNGSWLMNDRTALAIRKLKDADGHYLWNENTDTILGKPVFISEFMPDIADGSKPVLFGDFSYYWIVRRSGVTVRPLTELFAQSHQIGYLSFEYLDGLLSNREAVKSLVIGQ